MQRLLAEHDLRAGRPAEAQARLAPLLDRPGLEELDVTRLLPHLAWAHLELGDVTTAVAVAACGCPLRHPSPRKLPAPKTPMTACLPNLETTVSLTRPF